MVETITYDKNKEANKMRKYSIADRLKQIMAERKLKQVDILEMSKPFQEKFGINLVKSGLSQYVNGIQTPDDKKIYLLSKTLGVSEPWLMGYDVSMNPDEIVEDEESVTPQFRSIQRKAKNLSVEDQDRLLKLMEITFQDVLNGGGDNEHDF